MQARMGTTLQKMEMPKQTRYDCSNSFPSYGIQTTSVVVMQFYWFFSDSQFCHLKYLTTAYIMIAVYMYSCKFY